MKTATTRGKKPPSHWEIRLHEDGSFDEFCGEGFVHVEQMDRGAFWIGISKENGDMIHINFYTSDPARRKLSARCSVDRAARLKVKRSNSRGEYVTLEKEQIRLLDSVDVFDPRDLQAKKEN